MDFSQNVASLEPSATLALAARARRLREEGRSIVDLSAGEPVYGTPSFAAEAGIRAIREGRTGYPPTPGLPELRGAAARYVEGSTERKVDPAEVLVSAGVKQALFNCLFTLFGPGDEVLVAAPYWTSYLPQIRLAGARPVVVETLWEEAFGLDPERLEAARTERTRGVLLNSPSNPAGTVHALPNLEGIAAWADRHGLWVLSDEIYRQLHFGDEGPAPSLFDVEPLPERSVLLDGVSKSFSMTGWRIGFAVGPEALIRKAADLQSQTTSGAATPSQHAAAVALGRVEEREAALRAMRDRLRETREMGLRRLAEVPGLEVRPPEGGMFFFLRLTGGHSSAGTAERLLVESGVAVVPGEAFGAPGHLRLNFAVEPDTLAEGLDRLAAHFERESAGAPSPSQEPAG